MPARQAAVRLTLQNSQFLTEVKHAGDAVDRVAEKGKKSFQLFGGSADAAKRSISGLAGSVKNLIGLAGTFGGAFTVGGAIKSALELQRTYRQIAFGVKDAKGQMLQAAEVQRIVERSAALASQKNSDMAETFKELLRATGDLDFTRDSMAAIGTTALATGESLADITTVADQLHTKFGVTAKDMQDELAHVLGAATQGGPKFSEFADVIANVGAELGRAGLTGKRGLDIMLGALVATDDGAGGLSKQVRGLRALLLSLGDKSQLAKIGAAIGIDSKKLLNEPDAIARLRSIFSKGSSGVKALLSTIPVGDERDAAENLFIKPFQEALTQAKDSGLKGKAAIDAALVTFDAQIASFGKATMSGADVLKRAEEERRTPEAQLTAALNRITQAFDRPEIIKAITDLANHLPKLAELVADIVGKAAEHPIAAGAVATGLKVGGDVLAEVVGGAISAALGAAVKGMFGKKAVQGALTAAGGEALAGLGAGAGAGAAAAGAGAGAGAAGTGAAFTAAELTAAGIAPTLGTAALAAVSAAALPIAAIGAGGLAAGYGINRAYGNENDAMSELSAATAGASTGGSLADRKAALARLVMARKSVVDANIGGGVMDSFFRGITGVDNRGAADTAVDDAAVQIRQLQQRIANMEGGVRSAPGPGNTVRMPEVTVEGRPRLVALDDKAPRAIAEATKTALGGTVLTVRLVSGGTTGIPVANGRAPMRAGETRQGGGV